MQFHQLARVVPAGQQLRVTYLVNANKAFHMLLAKSRL
jgi:hypothetical protein